jgi:hypothetical protein
VGTGRQAQKYSERKKHGLKKITSHCRISVFTFGEDTSFKRAASSVKWGKRKQIKSGTS